MSPVAGLGRRFRPTRKARSSYTKTRGKGGFVRASWDEVTEIIAAANAYTAKTYGPDRVFGFSPIPAMSMVSYAAGSRYLSLLGRHLHVVLRLVLRPAALPRPHDLGRADRRAGKRRLVQCGLS
ncbi:MAG: molybdopterin-dependent oxidoreductase [Cypionkella sp.]